MNLKNRNLAQEIEIYLDTKGMDREKFAKLCRIRLRTLKRILKGKEVKPEALKKVVYVIDDLARFQAPCGPMDPFYTKCYHTNNCASSANCRLAVPGAGWTNRSSSIKYE